MGSGSGSSGSRSNAAVVIVLLEGRDASGKTTTARDIAASLTNVESAHRVRVHVVSVPPPTEEQKRGSYFRRWLDHLDVPTAAQDQETRQIIVFDRSWYNRALVERVMGFCTAEEVEAFFAEVPGIESDLMNRGGTHLVKVFFRIGEEEQAKRLEARRRERGELTRVDAEAIARRDAYTRAEEEMFARSSHLCARARYRSPPARTGTNGAADWIVLPESMERAERLIAVLAHIHASRGRKRAVMGEEAEHQHGSFSEEREQPTAHRA